VKYYFRKKYGTREPMKRSFLLSLLFLFGSALGWVYKMAFGGLDEAFYRRSRRAFIAEVNGSFSYLFSQHGGKVNLQEGVDFPRAFDYVSVTVEFKELRIRLIQGRGELEAELAPTREPGDWRDLSFLQQVLASPPGYTPVFENGSLDQLAGQLQTGWDQLVDLLSEQNWFPGLTLAEWRKFIRLPSEEKLAILAGRKPKPGTHDR
jgi:hypothetical protein